MKTILKAAARMAIALVLGLIYMWFLLSFAWSLDDMSVVEKIVGVVYGAAMIPLYYSITKGLGLR